MEMTVKPKAKGLISIQTSIATLSQTLFVIFTTITLVTIVNAAPIHRRKRFIGSDVTAMVSKQLFP